MIEDYFTTTTSTTTTSTTTTSTTATTSTTTISSTTITSTTTTDFAWFEIQGTLGVKVDCAVGPDFASDPNVIRAFNEGLSRLLAVPQQYLTVSLRNIPCRRLGPADQSALGVQSTGSENVIVSYTILAPSTSVANGTIPSKENITATMSDIQSRRSQLAALVMSSLNEKAGAKLYTFTLLWIGTASTKTFMSPPTTSTTPGPAEETFQGAWIAAIVFSSVFVCGCLVGLFGYFFIKYKNRQTTNRGLGLERV